MAKRAVKLLHVFGSTAYTGGLAAYMLLLAVAPADSMAEYAVLRRGVAAISQWIILPSLVVVLVSGLFTLVVHHPFQEQRWVWIKLILGLPMFEGTLLVIDSTAQKAAALATEAAASGAESAALQELIDHEWTGFWILMALSIANIVLSVFRPKLRRRRRRS